MTPSLLSRLVASVLLAVSLTAGIDYLIALRALRVQRLQQISSLLERLEEVRPVDGSRLTGEVDLFAPGSIVRIASMTSLSGDAGAHRLALSKIPQSLLACLATEGRICVRGNLVAIKFARPSVAGQVAIASVAYPPWSRLAVSIWSSALVICLLIWLGLRSGVSICLTGPLGAIEQATNDFVSNGFRSFALVPAYRALPKRPFPFNRLLAVGPELERLVSSFKRMATTLGEWRQKVADQEKQHQHWLSYLSHDLGAPLGRLLARLEALEYVAGLSEQNRRRLLDSARVEVTQLAEVIASISQFAMLDRGFECSFIETPLDPLLEHAVDVFEFEARQKRVELDLWVGPDIGKVRIEKTLLRRAIENLISNALQFTPEGGLISVRAECSEGLICITVSDTGLGISDHDLPRIFEFAFRGEQQTRPGCFGSRGLGLALVKQVAELHNGRVAARNLKTQGAEFVISIPTLQ
jgi:signal transduction histidine kinase